MVDVPRIESNEKNTDLSARLTLEEQIGLAVRETLAKQAQQEQQARALGGSSTNERNLESAEHTQTPVLSSELANGGQRGPLLAEDLETHLGRDGGTDSALGLVSRQLYFQHRQEQAFDRIADAFYPGFGRFEFNLLGRNLRFDYLNGRKCNLKTFSLCLSTMDF